MPAIFILTASFSFFVWLFNFDGLEIKNIAVFGAEEEKSNDLKFIAIAKMNDRFFGLFPKNNVFLLDEASIAEALRKAFPEVSRVEVSTKGLKDMSLFVYGREPVAFWCLAECFLVDQSGIAFQTDELFTDKLVRVKNGEKPDIGKTILVPGGFDFLMKLIQELDNFGFKTVEAKVSEGDYFLRHESGAELRFGSVGKPRSIAEVFYVIKKEIGDISSLDYADLRYGKKVFIKRK